MIIHAKYCYYILHEILYYILHKIWYYILHKILYFMTFFFFNLLFYKSWKKLMKSKSFITNRNFLRSILIQWKVKFFSKIQKAQFFDSDARSRFDGKFWHIYFQQTTFFQFRSYINKENCEVWQLIFDKVSRLYSIKDWERQIKYFSWKWKIKNVKCLAKSITAIEIELQ